MDIAALHDTLVSDKHVQGMFEGSNRAMLEEARTIISSFQSLRRLQDQWVRRLGSARDALEPNAFEAQMQDDLFGRMVVISGELRARSHTLNGQLEKLTQTAASKDSPFQHAVVEPLKAAEKELQDMYEAPEWQDRARHYSDPSLTPKGRWELLKEIRANIQTLEQHLGMRASSLIKPSGAGINGRSH